MAQKSVPVPLVATLIVVAVLLVGFFLYRNMSGGTVGDGNAGNVQASPPGQSNKVAGSATP